jgi:nitronate monooxygenase
MSFLDDLGLKYPVIQAPMSGGPSTAELVAAASAAGALGSLGAAYMTPEQIRTTIAQIREITDRPFAVNLFAGGADIPGSSSGNAMTSLLTKLQKNLGDQTPPGSGAGNYIFDEQLQVLIDEQVAVVSFTMGLPSAAQMAQLKQSARVLIATATDVAESIAVMKAGFDAVVAQGVEAGGHRGSFLQPGEQTLIGGLALIPQIVDAGNISVIASGGIMDGRGIVAALALGATAVQMGTAFLTCTESGASKVVQEALLSLKRPTTLTRMFSGRLARAVENELTKLESNNREDILPFPRQNILTRELRNASQRNNNPEYMSLYAGQFYQAARMQSVAELLERLHLEATAITAELRSRLS